jgi:hypothetical protein
MPRRSSCRTATTLSTPTSQLLLSPTLGASAGALWLHPVDEADCGSHHARQSSEALGPTAKVSTIDRTAVRNT